MAADTRPYKSKEQDGQGNEVIIRDQQLVEQSTVTTMPSGACFETFDIDGRPVKIQRDNMISIVLECMGIVLNDSSKNLGTNVNKALGLQGNTIGNVTVSDFASVLGARFLDINIQGYGTYSINNASGSLFLINEYAHKGNTALVFANSEIEVISDHANIISEYLTLSLSNGTFVLTSKIGDTCAYRIRQLALRIG